jgi:microsomal dipeptidase-like Zn-dependent dipeptidase
LPDAARDEVLGNLETLAARGVAMITLAHFYPNVVANPVFHLPEGLFPFSRWRQALARHDLTLGLGPLGEEVVQQMLASGMIIDVAHCTPAARAHVYRLAEAAGRNSAVIASHVGAQAINPSPYNLADWEIRWLADHGGIAGVIFMNYWLMPHETKLGLDFVSRTLAHFVDVGGSEVAAIGTDFDGFTDPPDDLLDASQLPRLTRRLVAARAAPDKRAFDDDSVKKILGGNALRVLRAGWRSGPAVS